MTRCGRLDHRTANGFSQKDATMYVRRAVIGSCLVIFLAGAAASSLGSWPVGQGSALKSASAATAAKRNNSRTKKHHKKKTRATALAHKKTIKIINKKNNTKQKQVYSALPLASMHAPGAQVTRLQ